MFVEGPRHPYDNRPETSMMIHAKIAVLAIAGALLTGCHGHHRAYGGGYGYYEQPRVHIPPPSYERPRYVPPRRGWDDDRRRRHHHDGWHRHDRD